MRQTIREIEVNMACRWFLGYDMTDLIAHFTTFGKNHMRRFAGSNVFEQVFERILLEAVRCKFVDASAVFINATHIKASANKLFQKVVARHVWGDYLEFAEDVRHTPEAKAIYARRKETIERVFADAKEKHFMPYTHYRGLAQLRMQTLLTFVCMNLKKLARWRTLNALLSDLLLCFWTFGWRDTKKPGFA